MKTKYYVDQSGNYIGGFSEEQKGLTEVPTAPHDARQKWVDGAWESVVKPASEQIEELEQSLTARNYRGAALGDAYAIQKMQEVEDQINALRGG